MAFVQQDVLGLDVAMDDVVAVRVVERIGHLDGDAARFVNGMAPPLASRSRSVCPFMTGITK